MTTEGGAPLVKLADVLAEDEVGVKVDVSEFGDQVRLTVDSTATTGKHAYLTADDADALADLLQRKAQEIRSAP
jgi:hypothetical protein